MRKVLILSPTFFPDTVVAAVRVSQWARHLPEFGWLPLVLCRHRGVSATPQALAEQIHSDVRVEYLGPHLSSPKTVDSGLGGRGVPSIRGGAMLLLDMVSVPDVLVWKWNSLSASAIAIAQQWRPDVVLSSSTPHSIHGVGRRIADATKAAWVADFRDPYLIDCRHQPRGLKRLVMSLHRRYERDIYRDASLCLHAIPLHSRWASRQYPFARQKIRTLTNGIPSELLDPRLSQSAPRSSRRSIRAVGILGQGAVTTIAVVLQQLLDKGIDVDFRHVGYARDTNDAVPTDLRSRLQLLGPVSHQNALQEIAGADVLLKYDDLERAKVIGLSSKLFEYLATGRPIIAVNPTRPDRQLLRRLPWCKCLYNPQPTALTEAIQHAIVTGENAPEESLSILHKEYNRRNQTEQLAGWLDQIVG